MFEKVTVNGYDELKKVLPQKSVRTIILFTGSSDPVTGKSWCPDCEAAEPLIRRCVQELGQSAFAEENDTRFVVCNVGDRSYWKDQNNPFRTDEAFKLKCVPTLLDLNVQGKRLTEEQLTNGMLLKAFFMEDID